MKSEENNRIELEVLQEYKLGFRLHKMLQEEAGSCFAIPCQTQPGLALINVIPEHITG